MGLYGNKCGLNLLLRGCLAHCVGLCRKEVNRWKKTHVFRVKDPPPPPPVLGSGSHGLTRIKANVP